MKKVGDFLDGKVVFGQAVIFQALGMIPILEARPSQSVLEIRLLEEALQAKDVHITEVSSGGEVSSLSVKNQGSAWVFILEGEELIGGKQNRIVNTSILIPGKTTVEIPVSCMEAGRWFDSRPDFLAGKAMFRARGRAVAKDSVGKGLKSLRRFVADQHAVWEEVSYSLREVGARSETQDFRSAREKVHASTEDYMKNIHTVEGQTGALFYSPKGIIGLELVGSPDLFKRAFQKILRSFVFEVFLAPESLGPASDEVLKWWNRATESEIEIFPSVCAGQDLRFGGEDFVGSGLILDDELVHLSCLYLDKSEGSDGIGQGGRLSPSQRRKRMSLR